MASLGMVLESYPDEVICFISDPKTGIQRRSKWPPTISEIVEACDQHLSFLQRCEKFKNWGKDDAPVMIEAPREERPTPAELRGKYGENWGLTSIAGERSSTQSKAPSWDEIGATYSADPSRLAKLLNAKEV